MLAFIDCTKIQLVTALYGRESYWSRCLWPSDGGYLHLGFENLSQETKCATMHDPLSISEVSRWNIIVGRALPLFMCHSQADLSLHAWYQASRSALQFQAPKSTPPTVTGMLKQRGTAARIHWRAANALSGSPGLKSAD